MLPRIGVTSWAENRDVKPVVEINRAFVDGVVRAGGVPYVLPVVDQAMSAPMLRALDGVVLTGGVDMDPAAYGATRHPEVTIVDAQRDAFEVALVRAACVEGIPVLGLCRGSQVVNVALGGTLIQHLPDHTSQPHALREAPAEAAHGVRVAPGSVLASVCGGRERLDVNTLHHQAADRLGENLRAVAWSDDGIVEAIEDPAHDVLGVQWHPELMLDHPDCHLALFEWLVEQAGVRRA